MTTKLINDGGPAMPFVEYNVAEGHCDGRYPIFNQFGGMSLRDYFAGQALTAYLSGRNIDGRDSRPNQTAASCYAYA